MPLFMMIVTHILTAQKLGCQIILSKNIQHLQQVGTLHIINPFVSDIYIIM
jgi:predicted nucleic acid-binding protein